MYAIPSRLRCETYKIDNFSYVSNNNEVDRLFKYRYSFFKKICKKLEESKILTKIFRVTRKPFHIAG